MCIEVDGRCNGTVECIGGNDEINCWITEVPESYNSLLTPPSDSGQSQVNVSVRVYDILDLDEDENKIRFKFKIYLFWRDTRLRFSNLRKEKLRNILSSLEFNKIWKPSLAIKDTNILFREINEPPSVIVRKESSHSQAAPNSVLLNSFIFDGEQSILQYKEMIR